MDEVLRNHETMIERLGRTAATGERAPASASCSGNRSGTPADGACDWESMQWALARRRWCIVRTRYCEGSRSFLEVTGKLEAMRACVAPALYRARKGAPNGNPARF